MHQILRARGAALLPTRYPAPHTMLKNLFLRLFARLGLAQAPEALREKHRLQATKGSDMAELAAQFLIAPTALMQLNADEARTVVSYMVPRIIAQGVTFIHEGDQHDTGFMVVLIEGEVMVETIVVSRHTPITITVLGPGSLIGEMGLVDGQARGASCTASTELRCAVLTRTALEKLSLDHPGTAAKLMSAVSARIAQRLREAGEKLKLYSQLTQAMQQEIDDHLKLGESAPAAPVKPGLYRRVWVQDPDNAPSASDEKSPEP